MRAGWSLLMLGACGFQLTPGTAIDASTDLDDADDDAVDANVVTASWLPGYGYRKPITITAGAVLDGFPISITTASDPDLVAHAGTGEFAFTADDGITVLPFEIAAYGTGTLDAWIRMTTIAGPVTVFMYYGGGATGTPANPWSAYAGVWHMSGTTAERDSSPNNNTSTAAGTGQNPTSATGVIGRARDYDGSNDLMEFGDTGSVDVGTGSFSYLLWVNVVGDTSDFDTPFHKGGSSPGVPGYDIELGMQPWKAEIVDTAMTLYTAPFNTSTKNQWLQLGAVVDRSSSVITFTSYLNGVLASSRVLPTLGSLDNNDPLSLGRSSYSFRGRIDEARVIKAPMPAAWFATQYRNATMRSSFVVIQMEQARP